MATDDRQVLVTGREDTPAHFRIPGNGQLRPKAVTAHYDGSGAGGDFLAALKITSDAGELVGVYPISSAIAAGASARVSWFPRVAAGAGQQTLPYLNQGFLAQGVVVGQSIPSGVVTPLAWTAFTSAPGYSHMFGTPTTDNPVTFTKYANVTATLTVSWPAANFDRYSELAVGAPFSVETIASPRIRHSVSPDGDLQTLCAVISGDPNNPTTITTQVFQASGVARVITAGISYHSIPYGVAPYVLP